MIKQIQQITLDERIPCIDFLEEHLNCFRIIVGDTFDEIQARTVREYLKECRAGLLELKDEFIFNDYDKLIADKWSFSTKYTSYTALIILNRPPDSTLYYNFNTTSEPILDKRLTLLPSDSLIDINAWKMDLISIWVESENGDVIKRLNLKSVNDNWSEFPMYIPY